MRLLGIDVYHDFPWDDHFHDARVQFKNGLRLAQFATASCPDGKTPALLLTDRGDVEQGIKELDDHYVIVVNLPELRGTEADGALTYLARRLGNDLTRLEELRKAFANTEPALLREFLNQHLKVEDIAGWLEQHSDRIEAIRAIVGAESKDADESADIARVIELVNRLGSLDTELVESLAKLVERKDVDSEGRLRLLRALTDDEPGRVATSQILGQRLEERIRDVEQATAEFAQHLRDGAGETELQEFLERYPWVLGLDYVQMRARRTLPRGAMDFILERFDGVHDLLELKSPQDPIIEAPDAVHGTPPPASSFNLSPSLAQALAQVHVYRRTLSTGDQTLEEQYGLRQTRDPRIIILIGQAAKLPAHRRRVLRDLNLSLHRVEVVPFDALADRAKTVLQNVRTYIDSQPREE